jgi:hypothetical protein
LGLELTWDAVTCELKKQPTEGTWKYIGAICYKDVKTFEEVCDGKGHEYISVNNTCKDDIQDYKSSCLKAQKTWQGQCLKTGEVEVEFKVICEANGMYYNETDLKCSGDQCTEPWLKFIRNSCVKKCVQNETGECPDEESFCDLDGAHCISCMKTAANCTMCDLDFYLVEEGETWKCLNKE